MGLNTKGPIQINGTTVIDENGNIIGDIQATAGSIGTTELADDVLSADAAGRAKIETGFFNQATISDTFESSSIPGDVIAGNAILASKLASPATTGIPGAMPKKYIEGFYNFSVDGGSQGTFNLCGTETFGDSYIVTNAYYAVSQTFTSSGDSATIALSIEGANDLVSAIAISDGTNPWDASGAFVQCIPDGTVGNFIILSDDRELTMTVGVEDLTAGKLSVILEVIEIRG